MKKFIFVAPLFLAGCTSTISIQDGCDNPAQKPDLSTINSVTPMPTLPAQIGPQEDLSVIPPDAPVPTPADNAK